jgi:N-acetylmuramoyl-L-alanine amidase
MKSNRRPYRILAYLLCALCALLPFGVYAAPSVFAAGTEIAVADGEEELPPVTLRIDERFVSTDVAPVIVEGRTLVPARVVFETLGGTVLWDDSGYPVQSVSVSYRDASVLLTIGAATAVVNGAEAQLDVPAQIVNDRTLIPVRFVSESLGFTVRWDEAGRIVDVYSPGYDVPVLLSEINEIAVTRTGAGTRVSINVSGPEPAVPFVTPSEPGRYSITFPNTVLTASTDALEWQREISALRGVSAEQAGARAGEIEEGAAGPRDAAENDAFEGSESGESDAEPLKTAAEEPEAPGAQRETAQEGADGQPGAIENAAVLFTFTHLEDAPPTLSSPDNGVYYLDFPKPQNPFDPWADGKLTVILDPGHGAETIGKRSPDESLLEYAFNRDMAARIKAHLERHGVTALLTVYDDTDMPLADRCKVANESGADIFVSLHANAYGDGKKWMKQNGWEIFVYKEGSFSEQFARAIHAETIPASGLADRGVKAERYYVIRNVNMPAVLIEHGFYTNQTEVELLKSPEFRERLAVMDAKGILRFLGIAWTEPGEPPGPTI